MMKKILFIIGMLILASGASVATFFGLQQMGAIDLSKETPIVIEIEDASKEYDGTPLVASCFEITDGALLDGDKITVNYTGTQTNVGESESSLIATIVNSKGQDVTSNYDITIVGGKLEVVQRPITIQFNDLTLEYTKGENITSCKFKVVDGTLAQGDEITPNVLIPSTVIGLIDEDSIFVSPIIKNENGEDVTNNYDVTTTIGTIVVNRKSITIVPSQTTKIYDGTEFRVYCTNLPDLEPGDQFDSFRFVNANDGTEIIDVGNYTAKIEVVIKNENGDDVSDYYEVNKYRTDYLEITKKPVEVKLPSIKDADITNFLTNYDLKLADLDLPNKVRIELSNDFKNKFTDITTQQFSINSSDIKIINGENYAFTFISGEIEVKKNTYNMDSIVYAPRDVTYSTEKEYSSSDFSRQSEINNISEDIRETITFYTDSSYLLRASTVKNPGTYYIKITFTSSDSSYNSIEPMYSMLTIRPKEVEIPEEIDKYFVYNGAEQTYEVLENDNYKVEGNKQKEVGTYKVKITLKDYCIWNDGSSNPIVYNFVIHKISVDEKLFTVSNATYDYDGENKQATVKCEDNLINSACKFVYRNSNGEEVTPKEAGIYSIYVEVSEKNYVDAIDLKIGELIIAPKIISKPEMPEVHSWIYDGKFKTLDLSISTLCTLSGNTATDAGTYNAVVSLKDKVNYVWNDLTTDDLVYEYTITPQKVEIPTVSNNQFIFNNSPQGLVIPTTNKPYTVIGNQKETNVGTYSVTVKLNDNYVWNDLTTGDLVYEYTITPIEVDIPQITTTKFDYTGEAIGLDIITEDMPYTVIGNQKEINVGTYSVIVKLNDNYAWNNGTTDDLTFDYTIVPKVVDIPQITTTKFDYTGETVGLDIITEDMPYTLIGSAKETNVGNYRVVVSLNNKKNYEWSDGTTADLTFEYTIVPQVVEIYVTTTKFEYKGKPTGLTLGSSCYTITGNPQETNVGTYSVTLSLNNKKNYEWEDGTTADLTIEYTITPKPISIPKMPEEHSWIYDGNLKKLEIPKNDEFYTISDNTATEAGTYKAIVSLKDSLNYMWEDETVADLEYEYTITRYVAKPSLPDVHSWSYDGMPLEIEEQDYYTISGALIDVGTHTVVISLNDKKNYEWSDGTTADLTYVYTISKAVVTIPNVTPLTDSTYDRSLKTLTITSNPEYYTISGNTATDAGTYTAIVSLNNKKNYEWSDGTTDDLTFDYTIYPVIISMPILSKSEFEYSGSAQGVTNLDSFYPYTVVGTATATNLGNYHVVVSLNDKVNYKWEDDTNDDLTFDYTIVPHVVEIPTVTPLTNPDYDGSSKTLNITSNPNYTISGNTATDAGTYTAIVSLNNKKNYEWSNGTTADLTYVYTISKAVVTIPTVSNNQFSFNNSPQGLEILTSNKPYTVIGNQKETNVGTYSVTVSLNNKKNYEWSDGTTADLTYVYTISKAVVTIPTVTPLTNPDYDGSSKTLNITSNPNYTISGNTATDAGTYTATVSLNDKKNYEWSDGTTADLTYVYTINKKVVTIPTVTPLTDSTYDRSLKTLTITSNPDYYTISGNTATDAGTYTAIVSLNNKKNYEWSDGTTADLTYEYIIVPQPVDKPETPATTSWIYDNSDKTLNLDTSDDYTISDNSAKNAGTYYATVSLNDKNNYTWSDGTTTDIKYEFTIKKLDVYISVNSKYNPNKLEDLKANLILVNGSSSDIPYGIVATTSIDNMENKHWTSLSSGTYDIIITSISVGSSYDYSSFNFIVTNGYFVIS